MKKPTKARLREQIECIAQGFPVHFDDGEDNPLGFLGAMGLKVWGRYVAALEARYGDYVHEWCFRWDNAHHFEFVSAAIEHIWQCWKPENAL